jgi:DNA-binding MarR family transcriptional regulator
VTDDAALPQMLRDTVAALVRRDGPDHTARKLAVVLIAYLENGLHTVRGLATRLRVPRPAISRVLGRLEVLKLVARTPEPGDQRSLTVGRTTAGRAYMTALRAIMNEATAATD